MAKKEIYRLDIKIGVTGTEGAKKKLSATEKFVKSSKKKMKALDKIKASPSARLNDKLSKPADKIKIKMAELDKIKVNPSVKLKDNASTPMDKVKDKTDRIKVKMSELDKIKVNPGIRLKDEASIPIDKIKNKTDKIDKTKAKPTVDLKDNATKPLKKIESRLSRFSKFACSKILAIATAFTLMLGGLGLSSTIKTFMDFEQGLANVKAVSGATAQEMRVLSKEAKRLGAATAWSAKEVTDAEMLLSQAGFSVNETISALPGLLDLASAGELDLAQATDITAGTLRAFGIEASKSAHVADVLGYTAAATNSDVSGLGESLKYVAPVSKSLGVSMEETTAAIGLLANANIKGSQAGTVLRAALARLANPADKAAEVMKKLGFKAFDAKGKMLPLDKVIGNLKSSMNGLTKQQQAQAVSTIFGTEAMSGMMALIEQGPDKLNKLTKELQNSDGAAKKMAETRLDSLSGQVTILKSAVEGMKIELGEKLAPYAKEFVTWFTGKIPDITTKIVEIIDTTANLAKKFNNLSTGTKKMFGAIALGILAFNPLSTAIKGTSKALTFLIGLSPKLSTFFGITKKTKVATDAVGALATGTGLATKGIGGLGLAAKAGALLLNPWVWAIGAATFAGVKLYKHFKKDSIPAVKEFGKEVSKSTADAMNAYMKLDKHVGQSLMDIKINNKKITKEIAQDVTGDFNKMSEQIKGAIDKKYNESYKIMQGFMGKASGLREEEDKKILQKIRDKQQFEKDIIDGGQKRINEIYQNAANQHRQITAEEEFQVNTIRDNMAKSAAENISKSAQEQRVILEKLKIDSGNLTAEQAAKVVENSAKARDGSIKEAEQQYNQVIAKIIHLRDDLGVITDEQSSKMIEAAYCQKEETVNAAKGMHEEVVMHAQEQASEHVNQVNWQTGEVLSNFDAMIVKIHEFNKLPIKEKVIRIVKQFTESANAREEKKESFSEQQRKKFGYATGTNNATSGIHPVAENGFEIVIGRQNRLFNGGEKVLNNKESRQLLQPKEQKNVPTKQKPIFQVAKPQFAGAGGSNINIDVDVENNFDNDTDIDEAVKQAMTEFGYKLKAALRNTKK